jgi:tRNA(fMet)-specific endonuclease VapC
MIRFVLDTDILSLVGQGHVLVRQRVRTTPADEMAITVITIEEQISGWYTRLRQAKKPDEIERSYQRLSDVVEFLGSWEHRLNYTQAAMAGYARLAQLKLQVRKMDLKIAAITLEHQATLVTRNLRDFKRIPGLQIVDWSV